MLWMFFPWQGNALRGSIVAVLATRRVTRPVTRHYLFVTYVEFHPLLTQTKWSFTVSQCGLQAVPQLYYQVRTAWQCCSSPVRCLKVFWAQTAPSWPLALGKGEPYFWKQTALYVSYSGIYLATQKTTH